ncbi:hypothetical protein C4D60_Mb00t16340 [Musa balbisiana]|uniref:Uncharacterized protein n=1 Tax=Musa balbisiana TaxID=52838 RepID=A0A4S8I3G2_MUSBA|nr:hypothetical protein C4D60_Mb00t16340 [Musa balbisiana]
MFQFARLSLACPWIQQQFERLTYSGISGSMLIFNSPKHFVACYALPRLWVPRYPPLSLACPWIQQQFERLTYSGISGSMLIFNSPKHFVACYALPRLWVPRYPP